MSSSKVHIRSERVAKPGAVVVELISTAIGDPKHAHELGQELASLVRPEAVDRFVLDFRNVKTFSSTGFGALVGFVLKVRKLGGHVFICNMDDFVRFGADIIRLGDYAPIFDDRQAALDHLAAEGTPGS